MPWSMPNSVSRPRRSSLDAVAITMLAPAALASWMAASPTPPAPACTSTVSPPCRWPNSNRQSSAVPNSIGTPAAASIESAVGDGVRRRRRHRRQLGVAARAHRGDHRLADREALDAGADLADRAGRLVADDVRGSSSSRRRRGGAGRRPGCSPPRPRSAAHRAAAPGRAPRRTRGPRALRCGCRQPLSRRHVTSGRRRAAGPPLR